MGIYTQVVFLIFFFGGNDENFHALGDYHWLNSPGMGS